MRKDLFVLAITASMFLAGADSAAQRKDAPLIHAEVMPLHSSSQKEQSQGEAGIRTSFLHPGLSDAANDSSNSQEPQILNQAVPVYPEKALHEQLEGRVIVKLLVTEDGAVKDAMVLKSTDQIFNQPSIDAAMKYKFTPAILRDKPVAVWVVIPFNYKLKPDARARLVDEKASNADYYREELAKANNLWMSYQDMIKQYDAAMYFERTKEYKKALKSYEDFVKGSKEFPMRPEEMVRHARLMIEKYSKMQKDGK